MLSQTPMHANISVDRPVCKQLQIVRHFTSCQTFENAMLSHQSCSLLVSWRAQLTDAVNEARDNLKYLRALDASWEPMYQQSSLAAVHNCLPAVLANIYTMHTISRYALLDLEAPQMWLQTLCVYALWPSGFGFADTVIMLTHCNAGSSL